MITDEQKEWIVKASDKGFTRLQIFKKLGENKFNQPEIEEMLNYFDSLSEEDIPKTKEEIANEKIEEKTFENQVHSFIEDPNSLSKKEQKTVRKWIKNMTKLSKSMDTTIKAIKKEIEFIKKNFNDDNDKLNKELEQLRIEMIERLWDTSEAFYITHPITNKTVESKEELKDISLEEAIELMELNNEELNLQVNGKE